LKDCERVSLLRTWKNTDRVVSLAIIFKARREEKWTSISPNIEVLEFESHSSGHGEKQRSLFASSSKSQHGEIKPCLSLPRIWKIPNRNFTSSDLENRNSNITALDIEKA